MKQRMKRITALMAAAAMVFSLAACGGQEKEGAKTEENAKESGKEGDEKITLKFTWWGSQSRHEYTQKMLDAYTAEHPEIEFEAIPAGWDGYFDKLSTQAASGSMPDIIQMDYLYIATYAKNNSLADLTPYIEDGTIDASGIEDVLLNTGKIDDKMAGLVMTTSAVTMGYNPDVYSKAGVEAPKKGWTYDDMIAMGEELKAAGVEDAISLDPVGDANMFNYWVRQNGEQLFADDNKSLGYADDKIMSDYFNMWKKLMDENIVPNPDEWEQLQTLGLEAGPVVTGEAAITQNWNNYSTLVAAANDKIKLETPPTLGAEDQKGLWNKPGMFFSISETCEHKKEAAEFINWFLNSEEANEIMMAERGTPSSAGARDFLMESGKLSQQQIDMFEYMDYAKDITGETPKPDPVGIAEINKLLKDTAYTVFYGQQSAEDAAASFREEANAILERNN